MSKKSATLIPKIIQAGNTEQAITVLNEVISALNLSGDYLELVSLRNELSEYQEKFNNICDNCVNEYNMTILNNVRIELSFLYREISDKLVFPINRAKIYHEENKTVVRGTSMLSIKNDEKIQGVIKATSTTALRDIVGLTDGYKDSVACISLSYGLYKNLDSLLTGIRLFIDSIASRINTEKIIQMKDVK